MIQGPLPGSLGLLIENMRWVCPVQVSGDLIVLFSCLHCQQLSVHPYRPYALSANTRCMVVVVVVVSSISSMASQSLQAIDHLFLTQMVAVFQGVVPVSAGSGANA